jgi:hypothetical protein
MRRGSSVIDFDSSESLQRDYREIRSLMDSMLNDAVGLLIDDVSVLPLAGRALVCRLARINIDGHLAPWGAKQDPEQGLRVRNRPEEGP